MLIQRQRYLALLRQIAEQNFTHRPAQDGARAFGVVAGQRADNAAPVAVINGATGGAAI